MGAHEGQQSLSSVRRCGKTDVVEVEVPPQPPLAHANCFASLMEDALPHLGAASVSPAPPVASASCPPLADTGWAGCYSSTEKNRHKLLQEALFRHSGGLPWSVPPHHSPPVQSPHLISPLTCSGIVALSSGKTGFIPTNGMKMTLSDA